MPWHGDTKTTEPTKACDDGFSEKTLIGKTPNCPTPRYSVEAFLGILTTHGRMHRILLGVNRGLSMEGLTFPRMTASETM